MARWYCMTLFAFLWWSQEKGCNVYALAGPAAVTSSNRRRCLQTMILSVPFTILQCPRSGLLNANAQDELNQSKPTISVTLSSPSESLGVEISDGADGSVRIKRVVSQNYPELREGMVVENVASAKELISRLRDGPYPLELSFLDDKKTFATPPSDFQTLSIVSTKRPSQCTVVGNRGEVIEIAYDAFFVTPDGREIQYDASSFRGTGQPYQMVLGSGDMIPGVDQGLIGMCVGESRTLKIPRILGHGARSRKLFGIPDDHVGLVWRIELVRAESLTL